MAAVVALVDAAHETLFLSFHIYNYWGHQPLNPYGFPFWWAAVNAGLPLVGAMLIYKLQSLLTGWRLLLIIPLMAMGNGIINGATAWPAWIALNSNWPMLPAQVAGVACYGLAGLFLWAAGHVLFPEQTATARSVSARAPAVGEATQRAA